MFKKFLLVLFLLFPLKLYASNYFVGMGGGESRSKVDGIGNNEEKSYVFSLGGSFGPVLFPVRTEIEYSRLKSKKDYLQMTKNESVGFNVYLGVPLLPILEPYVGIGVVRMREHYFDNDVWLKSDFKYVPQYMAGFDLDLPTVILAGGIEYRYLGTSFDFVDESRKSRIHTFLLKLRYKF